MICVGDVNAPIQVECQNADGTAFDLTGYTALAIYCRKSDHTKKTFTAVLETTAAAGVIEYLSVAGDVDAAGTWEIQAHAEGPWGKFTSEVKTFEVEVNISV